MGSESGQTGAPWLRSAIDPRVINRINGTFRDASGQVSIPRFEVIARVMYRGVEETDSIARRIVASVNLLADLTVEAIEAITPADLAAYLEHKATAGTRERELEAALRDVIEHTKTCGYDCEQGKLADSVNRARAALAAPARR